MVINLQSQFQIFQPHSSFGSTLGSQKDENEFSFGTSAYAQCSMQRTFIILIFIIRTYKQ